MNNQSNLNSDSVIKADILQYYDMAVKIVWAKPNHRKFFDYLRALTINIRIKTISHFGSSGMFYAFKFNDRCNLEDNINKIVKLLENENIQIKITSSSYCKIIELN